MARNPIVLIHGYSDEGASFKAWGRVMEERGYDVARQVGRNAQHILPTG